MTAAPLPSFDRKDQKRAPRPLSSLQLVDTGLQTKFPLAPATPLDQLLEYDAEALWAVVKSNATTELRAEALLLLASDEDDRLIPFILQELDRETKDAHWLGALLGAAETVKFVEERHRRSLIGQLERHARQALPLREKQPLLWMMIRRMASLVDVWDIDKLSVFLAPGVVRSTQRAALQAITNVFTALPNTEIDEALANRVFLLGEKLLDEDFLANADDAATALEATLALAAMGSPSLTEIVDRARQRSRPSFLRMLRSGLNSIVEARNKLNAPASPLLLQSLDSLRG